MENSIIYLAGPKQHEADLKAMADSVMCELVSPIVRRGVHLGWIGRRSVSELPESHISDARGEWQLAKAVYLPELLTDIRSFESQMEKSYELMERTLDGESVVDLLAEAYFQDRLNDDFQITTSYVDQSDQQGIEKIEFETTHGGKVYEMWMKASWLSFDEEDASMRFRFSFGNEGYEDVAGDFQRELLTGELQQRLFPESELITANDTLHALIKATTGLDRLAFVERIVYFNSPNGGAQFHHDVERGHDGVVYAQLFGSTAWLALPKTELIAQVRKFLNRQDAYALVADSLDQSEFVYLQENCTPDFVRCYLDESDNEPLEKLINRTPAFFQQLIEQGFAYILEPGDAILLPQASIDHCCWHAVFSLDDYPGEALSFAIRDYPVIHESV